MRNIIFHAHQILSIKTLYESAIFALKHSKASVKNKSISKWNGAPHSGYMQLSSGHWATGSFLLWKKRMVMNRSKQWTLQCMETGTIASGCKTIDYSLESWLNWMTNGATWRPVDSSVQFAKLGQKGMECLRLQCFTHQAKLLKDELAGTKLVDLM